MMLANGAAFAQAYKWVDKDGKTRYGDSPPPGVKATPMKPPAAGATPAAPASPAVGAKDAQKGAPPNSEQGFKERQLKAKEDADKAAKEQANAEIKKQNCERSRSQLRNLQSGQRISETNAAGERVFLEDDQRGVKIAESQKQVDEWCK